MDERIDQNIALYCLLPIKLRVNVFSQPTPHESCVAVVLNCPVRRSPAGGVFIGAKSFIPDQSFIPNQRHYLEYYYRHPISAAARPAAYVGQTSQRPAQRGTPLDCHPPTSVLC